MPPPLLVLSLAFIIGLLLPEWYPLAWYAPAALSLAFFIFGLFERRLSGRIPPLAGWRTIMPLPLGVVAALVLFGNALAMGSQPVFSPLDAAWYNERGEVRIIGVVDRPPDRVDQRQRIQVRVERLTPLYEGRSERSYPVKGLVLIQAPGATKLRYGDRVRITGNLKTPEDGENFSYRDFLARKGIYSLMPVYGGISVRESGAGNSLLTGIYGLREQAYMALTRSIPQPEASLLAGILLGIETDMPDDLDRAFQNTGTSHIIAISGFNIAILSTLFCGIFIRFTPKLLAPFLAILAIAAYTVLVGAQASVVRAAIMGAFIQTLCKSINVIPLGGNKSKIITM
jgi:competence protein ComEC